MCTGGLSIPKPENHVFSVILRADFWHFFVFVLHYAGHSARVIASGDRFEFAAFPSATSGAKSQGVHALNLIRF